MAKQNPPSVLGTNLFPLPSVFTIPVCTWSCYLLMLLLSLLLWLKSFSFPVNLPNCLFPTLGPTCAINIDECSSNPCLNQGTCDDGVNGYSCRCTVYWEGTRCQIDVDECQRGYCRNGASCTHGIGTYSCSCAVGWAGVNCTENIDECLSAPCRNGGQCEDFINSYRCNCASG